MSLLRVSPYVQRRGFKPGHPPYYVAKGAANPNYKRLESGYQRTTPDLSYIVGVLMGDGYLRDDSTGLEATDREFVNTFGEALRRQFGRANIRPGLPERDVVIQGIPCRARPTTTATLYSVEAASFLRTIETEEWVRALPVSMKIDWLRGVWDSEGYVSFRQTSGKIAGFRVSEEWLAVLYRDTLYETMGISVPVYRATSGQLIVDIGRREDVSKFYKTVQPTIERKRERLSAGGYKCP